MRKPCTMAVHATRLSRVIETGDLEATVPSTAPSAVALDRDALALSEVGSYDGPADASVVIPAVPSATL